MRRLFTEHPESVGETYFQHMGQAFSFSFRMFGCAIACFFHGLFPFLFVKTGSKGICELHERMVTNRSRLEQREAPQPADRPAMARQRA